MPLISVVIPVHGVEDYLDRCLDSVLGPADLAAGGGGSAVSLEVIAVDDASPDRCGAILAARQDPRLRVLTTTTAAGPAASQIGPFTIMVATLGEELLLVVRGQVA